MGIAFLAGGPPGGHFLGGGRGKKERKLMKFWYMKNFTGATYEWA